LSPSLFVAEKAKPRWLIAVRLAAATARTAPETAKLRLYMMEFLFIYLFIFFSLQVLKKIREVQLRLFVG